MKPIRKLNDEALDQLLAGTAPAGQEGFEGLAAFAKAIPAAYTETPRPEVESVHLAQIARAQLEVDPATVGAMSAVLPGRSTRRRNLLSTIFGTLAAKLAVATVAAAAATGGLAATSSLPTPAQNAVASAASHIGVHFPTKGEAADADSADASQHGKTVSDTARNTELTGRDKGKLISGTAKTNSANHRQDGVHRPTGTPSVHGRPSSAPTGNPTGFGQGSQPSGNPTGHGRPSSAPTGNPTTHGRP